MSQQALPTTSRAGLGRAIAGVVFCDFIGLLLFAIPMIGWVLGLITMFGAGPAVAWSTLEGHPRRGEWTLWVGVGNAVGIVVLAAALIAIMLSVLSGIKFG